MLQYQIAHHQPLRILHTVLSPSTHSRSGMPYNILYSAKEWPHLKKYKKNQIRWGFNPNLQWLYGSIHDPRSKMQDARSKIQDPRSDLSIFHSEWGAVQCTVSRAASVLLRRQDFFSNAKTSKRLCRGLIALFSTRMMLEMLQYALSSVDATGCQPLWLAIRIVTWCWNFQ